MSQQCRGLDRGGGVLTVPREVGEAEGPVHGPADSPPTLPEGEEETDHVGMAGRGGREGPK